MFDMNIKHVFGVELCICYPENGEFKSCNIDINIIQ